MSEATSVAPSFAPGIVGSVGAAARAPGVQGSRGPGSSAAGTSHKTECPYDLLMGTVIEETGKCNINGRGALIPGILGPGFWGPWQ